MVAVKYSNKLAKLSKLRDVDSFKALVEKLLRLTENEPEHQAQVLRAACINASRLKLWTDGYSLASQFFTTQASKDVQVIKALTECVVNSGLTDQFDRVESLISSVLARSSVVDSLDDIDVNELRALKSLPIVPTVSKLKKRKHKQRYPKGFDLEKPGPLPDPERWLPKNQRTKQQKKSKKSATGFQGSAAASSAAPAVSTAQAETAKERRRRK